MTTPELLPCPHCGNAYPAVGYDSDMRALGRDACITARCRQCGAETRKCENERKAAELWNTRAPLSPAVLAELPEVKRLVADALDAAADKIDARGALEQKDFGLSRATQNFYRARDLVRDIAAAIREGRT